MPSEPVLSICIPTYNRISWCKQTVDKVSDISDRPFEFVIVDEPNEIKTPFSDYNLDIQYIQNEQQLGFAKSVIKAVKEANGKFVMLLSDEDFVSPNSIDHILKMISEYESATRIVGIANNSNGRAYIDPLENIHDNNPIMYKYPESVETFYFSQPHLSGPIFDKTVLDFDAVRKYLNTPFQPYVHTILTLQSTLAGSVINTPTEICKLGATQIKEHDTDSEVPESRPLQQFIRVEKVIPDFIEDRSIQARLIQKEQEIAAFYTVRTLAYNPAHIYKYLKNLKNVEKVYNSTHYWLHIPRLLFRGIVQKTESYILPNKHLSSSAD